MASKSKVKKSTPLCDIYDNNPANIFRAIVRKMNYYRLPSIKVNNGFKIKGKKLCQRSEHPNGTSTHAAGCVCAVRKQSSKRFARFCPETKLITQNQLN